jgi:hypothetical protein
MGAIVAMSGGLIILVGVLFGVAVAGVFILIFKR